ncbi:MAG: NAD(+) kinase [Gammaproteobacteria bacterium]|nr:NAD(+) kinase [Gammaproteobacteria bacterium]
MNPFSTIGLIVKEAEESHANTLSQLIDFLLGRDLRVLMEKSEFHDNGHAESVNRNIIAEQSDLVIILGGDGTFLNAARSLVDKNVPLMGINLGRLGFLVDVSPKEMLRRLEEILTGNCITEERFLLDASIHRGQQVVHRATAFNDVVIHSRVAVRMIEIETFINNQLVHVQRADGLILATPTGSTAYSLSGGGPIMHPDLETIAIVPICPHTLSNRPIVVSADSCVEMVFSARNRTQAQVSFDGQSNFDLEIGDRITIKKHPAKVQLIHPSDHDHYSILRKKLNWASLP